jgi:RNA polymerase sigma-70 factor, ECF subfamily
VVSGSSVVHKDREVSRFPQERLGDAELVEAVARGDSGAAGVVWDRYSGLVRSVLRANLGPDPALEDLLQEVFIVFLRGAADLRSGGALRPYLVSVAVRLVLVELRRRRVRRWVTLSPTGEVPQVPSAPQDIAGSRALGALYRLLEQLPRRRRVAFVLRHVQALEMSEVALALGVSESTAKREAARARRSIVTRAERHEPALWEYLKATEGARHE